MLQLSKYHHETIRALEGGPAGDDSTPDLKERSPSVRNIKPFLHRELLDELDRASVVKRGDIINLINYLHFIGHPLFLQLTQMGYPDALLCPVHPEPCDGDRCILRLDDVSEEIPDKYVIRYLFVPSHDHFLMVPVHVQQLGEDGRLSIPIPEKGYRVNRRSHLRFESQGLFARICQNAFQAEGALVDFSASGLRIRLAPKSISSMRWFNESLPVLLHLISDRDPVFISLCPCIRFERGNPEHPHIVLLPGKPQSHQFPRQKVRNPRHQMTPSFGISFVHPFLSKKVRREVHDITTSGFSVVEKTGESLLLTGLILHDLSIVYAGVFEIPCRVAQVVYRVAHDDGNVRCGVAILDMDLKDYTKLANILTNAMDPHARISCEVDLDDLWSFFFKSGFIYPQKYKSIEVNRAAFKRTYEKLYETSPDIVRHFTYQKSGRIFGHISLVRAYEKTWMFHHLLAKSMDGKRIGPMVMKQITHFTHDMHRLPSAHMDYMMCYYQPGNRFSSFVFGGFAKQVNDPKICSQDLFSYIAYPGPFPDEDLSDGWCLEHFQAADLFALRRFYERASGGLLLEVLQLGREPDADSSVEAAYNRGGFTRKSKLYSLLYGGTLKAVVLVNETDSGFNLSNLLNCVTVIVCDPRGLSWEILLTALRKPIEMFPSENIPILLYPSACFETQDTGCESKEYFMWIIDACHVSDFMVTSEKQSKIGHWK